jgi:hypothetical protein
MWIDGLKGFFFDVQKKENEIFSLLIGLNDTYQWNVHENIVTPIIDKYWCDNIANCSGGKGRDHVVLNIVCQTNKTTSQVCLASRRQSEPGPFICKRTLKSNESKTINQIILMKNILI